MMRKGMLALIAGLMLSSMATAQSTPWRFHWKAGEVLTYRVEQTTSVSEVVGDKKTGSSSKLNLTKRWQVQSIDAAGVATLQLSLAALRLESIPPDGEALLFDSANLDKSSPQLREQMQRYVNQPLATIRIDPRGQVLEVKESKFGPASRYLNELPFALVLPEKAPAPTEWERSYQIVLDPPQGAGEKFDAVQKYTCTAYAKGLAVVKLTTALKQKPENVAEEMPLLQFQPQGEIIFSTESGQLRSVKTTIDREVTGHQGPGSKYRCQSNYVEEYVAK